MKLGTHIKLGNGREATVTFNGLCGVGIIYGLHTFTEKEIDAFKKSTADLDKIGLFNDEGSDSDYIIAEYEPVAILRDKKDRFIQGMECVGRDFTIIKEGIDL